MATYVDMTNVIKRLQEMGVTGDIFFVDTAGNDANPGTYALPCLTIDHTVGLCAAYHNDAVVVTDSLFNNYDESVNVDGVQLDVAGMTLVGIGNDILVTNTNVAAVSTFHITADQVNIYGINGYGGTFPSLHTEDGDWCMIGKEGWKTTFQGATGGTGIFHEEGSNCKYQYIDIDGVSTGIQLQDMYNEIHHCNIQGDNAGGSLGITLDTPGASNWNYIHDNAITNFALGLDAAINTLYNIFADNAILCFLPTSDGNAANVNGWINNKVPGEISRGGLLQSDLASINSRGFPEAGQNVSGTYRFVSTGGSDANGSGTWARPYATITYAMGLSSDGDTIICVDPTFAVFDENTVVAGLVISSGVTVIGIGMPWLTNSNVGATSVVDIQDNNARLTGFVVRATVAGCAGVVMNANTSRVDHCELQDGGAAGIGIQIVVAPVEVDNNFINAWTTGIEDAPGTEDKIHDNTINNCATAISLIGVGAGAMIRHNWLYQTTPGVTVAFSVAGTCGVHNITDNYVHGYPANSFLAPVNFVSNHIESQIAANNTLEEDLGAIYGAISSLGGPSVGNVFFVDTAGNDANPGTYAQPCLTIDHTVGLCTADHDDAIVVMDSLGAGYDENVNVDGIQLDVAGVTLIGTETGGIYVDNTNVGATATVHMTASGVKLVNITINQSTSGVGVLISGSVSNCIVGSQNYQTTVWAMNLTGIRIDNCGDCRLSNVDIDVNDGIGIDLDNSATANEIDHCAIRGTGGAGSIGIRYGATLRTYNNYSHDNNIQFFETGISVAATSDENRFVDESITRCATTIFDGNAANVNDWVNNKTYGEISRSGSVQSDLASINSRGFPDAGENSTGKFWFVSTGGSDANGNGTWARPYRTITAAMALASVGDTILCVDALGLDFDENTVAGGLVFSAGVTVKGVGFMPGNWPVITNSNVGATSVANLGLSKGRLTGFRIDCPAVAGVHGVVLNSGATRVDHCEIEGALGAGIYYPGGSAEADHNTIRDCVTGIEVESDSNDIHDNEIIDSTTAVKFTGTAGNNKFRKNWLTHIVPAGTIAVDIAATCGVNHIADNDITGYPANAILAPTNWLGNKPPLDVVTGVDSQLTVANGTGTITIATPTMPALSRVKDVTLIINGAYAGGGNDSFKAHAAALSYLEAWIEIQTVNDANWRRLTPSTDAYRIYQNDTQDCLVLDNINLTTMYRVRAALSAAPTDTIDLDWQILNDV